jgi:hypothetical protein
VSGDSSLNGNLFVGKDASLNSRLVVGSDVTVNKDLTIKGRLNVQNYTNNNIINTTVNNYQLIVSEDLSLNGRLVASSDVTVNNITVGRGGGDLSTNTVFGTNALSSNTTGSNNTAVGYKAGYAGTANTTGSNNTYVGYNTQANGAAYSDSTALGAGATITASNQIMIGRSTEKVYIAGNGSYPLPYIVASGSQTLTATAGAGRVNLVGTFSIPSGYSSLFPICVNGDTGANASTLIIAGSPSGSTISITFTGASATYFRVNYVIYAIP